MLEIIQIPVLNDNYIYLLHDSESAETAVIDPALSQPVCDTLSSKGWTLNYIYNTHHHWDHVGANVELKEKFNCTVFASEFDQSRIPGIDKTLKHGDKLKLGNQDAEIIATPGHTLGHIVYHFKQSNALFCGDTLFSMGCGRLFEGTAKQMWGSLHLLKQLPKETQLYCAHEYTLSNNKFALTLEPDNLALLQRYQEVKHLRANDKATIPSTLEKELATNPFLREDSLPLQQSIKMTNRSALEVFEKTRELKDNYKN